MLYFNKPLDISLHVWEDIALYILDKIEIKKYIMCGH